MLDAFANVYLLQYSKTYFPFFSSLIKPTGTRSQHVKAKTYSASLFILNELGQVVNYGFTKTESMLEIEDTLRKIHENHPDIEMIILGKNFCFYLQHRSQVSE